MKKWTLYIVSVVLQASGILAFMADGEEMGGFALLAIKLGGAALFWGGIKLFDRLDARGELPESVKTWIAGHSEDTTKQKGTPEPTRGQNKNS
ncbi:hypothetical protein [Porphyromonas endodontalis]